MWVANFIARPLYPQGKRPRYPSDRRVAGPQSWSWRGGEGENNPAPAWHSTLVVQPVA
jgi:hypothetical protein